MSALKWYHVIGIYALGILSGINSPLFWAWCTWLKAAENYQLLVSEACQLMGYL